jgi:hypothetical protein
MKFSKILLIMIMAVVFLGIWQNCSAEVNLLLKYPKIGGEELGEQSTLPQLIRYIYRFALGICGIVALISIIIGAFRYASAGGNSSQVEDAKDQITQALLGLLLLLAAVVILHTINPDLVNLKLSIGTTPTTPEASVKYKCVYCCGLAESKMGQNCMERGTNINLGFDCKSISLTSAGSECNKIAKNKCKNLSPHDPRYKIELCK